METFFCFFPSCAQCFFSFYSQFLSSCTRMFSSYTQCFFSNFFFLHPKEERQKSSTPTKEKKTPLFVSVRPSIHCLLMQKSQFLQSKQIKDLRMLIKASQRQKEDTKKKKTTHIFRAFRYKNLRTTFANHTEIQRQKHIK